MKFVAGENGRPREKSTKIPIRPPRNRHGEAENRTRDPSAEVGGERLTACVTEPLLQFKIV